MKQKLAVAVDLGATNVRVALVSPNGEILHKLKEETIKTGANGNVVTTQIERLIPRVFEERNGKQIAGIGISSMGPLDHQKGGSQDSPNVPFRFIPLVKPLQKAFAMPVLLFKDTHAAVLAEKRFGAGKNVANLVYITISTGIGGGAITDGKLLYGKSRNAAEIGHLIVDTTYAISCPTCGNNSGHWESLASGRNIPQFFRAWARQKKKKMPRLQTAKEIFEEAKRNSTVRQFLDDLARINAKAISDIIVAYDPELITIGGSVALNNQSIILQGIKKYVDHYLKAPKIQITKLGEDISLLGAATAVFQKKDG
ncbi:MAG TPA: ROK family protein [Candidatus Paceibacterota bacterium]